MMSRLATHVAAIGVAMTTVLAPAYSQESEYDTSRVVAIGGSITEIVYALGQEDKLIARDSTSVFPAKALALPDVGYMRALSPEGVLSVDPSVIITLEGSGPPEALEVLEKASVPMVTIPDGFDREGILEKVRIVGEVLGVPEEATALAEQIGEEIDAALKATAGIETRKKVLFVLSLQGGRILASGTGTAADGIIAMAGGVNAVTDYPGYKQLTDEAVIEAAPDVILSMSRGGDHEAQVDQLLGNPAIAATPAAVTKSIVRMDGAYLLGFGPRTAAAARELAVSLYGDLAKD
ncbi:ABC transporter substrate-binding protein [Mesorhizobium sp. CAU 1741]|uniref:heme/hemin ABC transporter substrate-binding protein n=1 Tax=Mesorhizobium sp. CAU 1741 TaxID=3140366 RepID=UPI00325B04C1